MKVKEIKELTADELNGRRRELKEEMFHLRIQQQNGQLEKPSQIKTLRREVARLETFRTQKSKAASAAAK